MVFLRNELRHYQSSVVQHLTFSVGYSVMLHCCRKVIGYNLQYNRDVRYQIISHIGYVGSRSTYVKYSNVELKSTLVFFFLFIRQFLLSWPLHQLTLESG